MELINIESCSYFDTYNIKEFIKNNRNLGMDSILFHLIKQERVYPKYLTDKWIFSVEEDNSEVYTSLKEVDEITFLNMYGELFNPVSVEIRDSNIKCMLYSIDDVAIGFGWENLNLSKLEQIKYKLFDYIDSINVLNYKEFLEFGIKNGATDYSW